MKRSNTSALIASAIFLFSFFACTEDSLITQEVPQPMSMGSGMAQKCKPMEKHLKPIVSYEWLKAYQNNVTIVDVRTEEEYLAGHIPGSISMPFVVPFSDWIVSGDLLMELPEVGHLETIIGAAGISNRSKVVLVTGIGQPPFPLASATRVAATLHYLGFYDVTILDGGFDKWVAKGGDVSTDPTTLPATRFFARPNSGMWVSTDYVAASIGSKIIIDTRDAEVYSGEVIEPWALVPGHIPSALSLPAVLIWNEDGTYKSKPELHQIVKNVLGNANKNQEIIIYCGVGGYTSSMYYVMHSILGYKNLKLYDGSAQAWVMEHDMEL